MQKQDDPRAPKLDAAAAAPRPKWSRPQLVPYGHLAKLTRGTSGSMAEGSGLMRTPCL